eukprot:SAG31_NODE_3129_length_4646_cov_2.581262_3_plen_285_part_00
MVMRPVHDSTTRLVDQYVSSVVGPRGDWDYNYDYDLSSAAAEEGAASTLLPTFMRPPLRPNRVCRNIHDAATCANTDGCALDTVQQSDPNPPLQCSDHAWTDRYGKTCANYDDENLCTVNGQVGDGWQLLDPLLEQTFADRANTSLSAGNLLIDATTACCACGGGQRQPSTSTTSNCIPDEQLCYCPALLQEQLGVMGKYCLENKPREAVEGGIIFRNTNGQYTLAETWPRYSGTNQFWRYWDTAAKIMACSPSAARGGAGPIVSIVVACVAAATASVAEWLLL